MTDTDPTAVRLDVTHPALPGGGDPLWEGGALVFPAEDDGSGGDGNQVYRSVAAALQAPLPECHDGTAELTVSVRVSNDGPDDGVGYVGGLKLYEDGDPEDFDNRTLDSHNTTESAPMGHVETLTVSAQVPAEDLAAGLVFVHLAAETHHGIGGNTGTQWTADQLVATYAFDTTSCASGIALDKSGSGPDPLGVGDTVEYSFVVTNTGDVTLTNVDVTDPLPGLSPVDCPDTTVAPAAEMTCTATYEVTQADVDAGAVENTATVSGESPAGGPTQTDTSTATMPTAEPVPALPPLAFVLLLALLATGTLWTLRRARA